MRSVTRNLTRHCAGVAMIVALTFGALAPAALAASDYPRRAVHIIVPFPPGGPVDILARMVASGLGNSLKQPFVVETRPGASGNAGMATVARSDPDGYTLLMTSSALMSNPGLFTNLPFDPIKDFEPIGDLGVSPNVFVAYPKSGITSMEQLVSRAREKPGSINIATTGIGTTPHLTIELLKLRANVNIVDIPYTGSGASMQAILGGTTETGVSALPPTLPLIKSGLLIGLAVSGTERWPALPDVPTMIELGYKDFVLETAIPFLAPANTPKDIVDTLAKATIEVLQDPAVRKIAEEAGFQVLAKGPDDLKARIAKEVPMYRDLIEKAGIKRQK